MNVIVREIASVPVRTTVGTWQAVVDLLAPQPSAGRDRLLELTNVAAVLIAEEYTTLAPIIVLPGSGPRVRVRTVHGLDGVDTQSDEMPLTAPPCAGEAWRISLPCGIEDIEEIRASLKPHPWAEVRDVTDGITAEAHASVRKDAPTFTIDIAEMER